MWSTWVCLAPAHSGFSQNIAARDTIAVRSAFAYRLPACVLIQEPPNGCVCLRNARVKLISVVLAQSLGSMPIYDAISACGYQMSTKPKPQPFLSVGCAEEFARFLDLFQALASSVYVFRFLMNNLFSSKVLPTLDDHVAVFWV